MNPVKRKIAINSLLWLLSGVVLDVLLIIFIFQDEIGKAAYILYSAMILAGIGAKGTKLGKHDYDKKTLDSLKTKIGNIVAFSYFVVLTLVVIYIRNGFVCY